MDVFKAPRSIPQDLLLIQDLVDVHAPAVIAYEVPNVKVEEPPTDVPSQDSDIASSGDESDGGDSVEEVAAGLATRGGAATDDDEMKDVKPMYVIIILLKAFLMKSAKVQMHLILALILLQTRNHLIVILIPQRKREREDLTSNEIWTTMTTLIQRLPLPVMWPLRMKSERSMLLYPRLMKLVRMRLWKRLGRL